METQKRSRPGSNRGPFACKANVITTTLRDPCQQQNSRGDEFSGGISLAEASELFIYFVIDDHFEVAVDQLINLQASEMNLNSNDLQLWLTVQAKLTHVAVITLHKQGLEFRTISTSNKSK